MSKSHFSRSLTVTLSEAYRYYSNIEAYPQRYGRYYGTIDVLHTTPDTLTLRMFLNISLSRDRDHENVEVRYLFIPEKEIQYEFVKNDGQPIKSAIILRGQDEVGDKLSYKSGAAMNHVPLILMSYPPDSLPREDKKYQEYQRMILYFIKQDMIHLERNQNVEGWKIGQQCPLSWSGQIISTWRGRRHWH